MSANFIAVTAKDVTGTPVIDFSVKVFDPGSQSTTSLTVFSTQTEASGKTYWLYDIGSLSPVDVEVNHPQYFQRKVSITRSSTSGNLSSATRSTWFGLYGTSTALPNSLLPLVEVVMSRVAEAPIVALTPIPNPTGPEGKVIADDVNGLWVNANKLLLGLFSGGISSYPVIVNPVISKNPTVDGWDRFNATVKTVDPQAPTGGNWFRWLQYGDPTGVKFLVAIWAIGRAGARPVPNDTDALVFYSPRTDIPPFAPKDLYPYKRKVVLDKVTNKLVVVQPYSELAYRYLSAGSEKPSDGLDFGFAYQGMAANKSFVLIMPIQMYGFAGPVLAQDGLMRLVLEILSFVGDNTKNTKSPYSDFGLNETPRLRSLAVAGYSNGMNDVRQLLKTQAYSKLSDDYDAFSSTAAGSDKAQYADWARRLRALPQALWASPDLFEKSCKEVYSIDGYFNKENMKFQNEMAAWFGRGDDRMLRVYGSDGRFKDSEVIVGTKLEGVFSGVTPSAFGTDPVRSKEYHRRDGRASFVWFTERYLNFSGVDFMPDTKFPGVDAHHTLPRIVLSHAIAMSGFATP